MNECLALWKWGPMVFISLFNSLWDTTFQNKALPGRWDIKWWKLVQNDAVMYCLIPLPKTHSVFFQHFLCLSSFTLLLPLPPSILRGRGTGEWGILFYLLSPPRLSLSSVLISQHLFVRLLFSLLLLLPLFPFLSWRLQFGFPCFAKSRPNFTLQEMREYTGQELLGEWVPAVPGGLICLLYRSPCCPQSAKLLMNGTARCHISSPLDAE